MKMIVADCAMLSQQHNFDEQKINYWDVFQETADLRKKSLMENFIFFCSEMVKKERKRLN